MARQVNAQGCMQYCILMILLARIGELYKDSSAHFDVPNESIVVFSLLQEPEGVAVIPFAEPIFGSRPEVRLSAGMESDDGMEY